MTTSTKAPAKKAAKKASAILAGAKLGDSETVKAAKATAAPSTIAAPTAAPIVIERLGRETIDIPIVGTSPLIVHNWSEKAKREMLDAQQGKRKVKQHRDPQADYEAAFYRIARDGAPDGYGFPSLAFKAALVSGARHFGKSVTMVTLRQSVFIDGIYTKADPQRLVEIQGEPWMREDVVTVGMGGRDLRYRPQFDEWSAVVRVIYVPSSFARESVLSLLEAGGMTVGVGEWRPEKKGEFGTFMIDPDREIEVVQ